MYYFMKIMLGGKYMLEQFHIHADLKQQLSTIHEKNKQEAGENAHLMERKYIKRLIIALLKMRLQHFFLARIFY